MAIARHKGAWTVGATILCMLLVGWPVLTAMSALFWSVHIFDARSDADKAADRIIEELPDVSKNFLMNSLPATLPAGSRDCESEGDPYSGDITDIRGRTTLMTRNAIERLRYSINANEVYLVELTVLKSLPMPVLGALDGCMSASLLASYCEDRARDIVQRSIEDNRAGLQRKFAKNALLAAGMFCVLMDGVKKS